MTSCEKDMKESIGFINNKTTIIQSQNIWLNRLQVSNEATQHTLDTIISYIEKTPGCKLTQIQDVIGKSLATTKRYVQLLRENGIIEYIGSPKTGGYKLNK